MIPDNWPVIVLLAGLGLLVGALLWAFGTVPWWGIPICVVAVPAALIVLGGFLFVMLWLASGGH